MVLPFRDSRPDPDERDMPDALEVRPTPPTPQPMKEPPRTTWQKLMGTSTQSEHEKKLWDMFLKTKRAEAVNRLGSEYMEDVVHVIAPTVEGCEQQIGCYREGSLANKLLSRVVPKLAAELEGNIHTGLIDLTDELKKLV
jgi:hypothetical protein